MERSFKGVWIPREIWLSKDLTLQEKVFLVEIGSLDNDKGCFASNNYFAEFFGLSKNRCSEIIKALEKKQLVSIDYIREGNKKNIQKRVIKVFDKSNRGIRKIEEGYSEKCEGNNTLLNNTNIYTIFEFWNEQSIIVHRKITTKMKRHINARLEDYSEEELKQAISNYNEILKGDEYYWTHRWTLEDFMKPSNVIKFLKESDPHNNYAKNKSIQKNTFKPQNNNRGHNLVDEEEMMF
ncbi:helix-turn-helix domain-containing protein [Oceanobacillus kimchii]|uniref:helix-turn-helix domain-containing protein n=1 Tax=Oceanobacillus kimchii TaxID=746691 RepID=UPI003B01FEEE